MILKNKRGFSLIELTVLISILSVLAAILLPVFTSVRRRAYQSSCLSNLKQIGAAISVYNQDNDGFYPYAVDPVDRLMQPEWKASFPRFGSDMENLEMVQEVLSPYLKSPQLFKCPADTGFEKPDFIRVTVNAYPSSYEKLGTSYFYRTEIAAHKANESSIEFPSQINLIYENVGYWHGTLVPITERYNVLFCDGHVSNIGLDTAMKLWDQPLNPNWNPPSMY